MLTRGYDALDYLERHLAFADYLAGDGLSLADIALVAYTRLAPEGGFSLERYPSIQNWIVRIENDLGIDPVGAS